MASHLASKGTAARGLVLLSYPLHPPGKEDLRTKHFGSLSLPCLFVQGTRDPFGTPAELALHVKAIPGGARIVAVEGGDHSWEVPTPGLEAQYLPRSSRDRPDPGFWSD